MSTITINTTDFFSYADQSEADAYLLGSIDFATWDANDEDTKGRFLISATRLIDSLTFKSEYDTQAKRDLVEDIHNVTILIANAASNGNTAIFGNSLPEQEQKRLKSDIVEIEYFRNFNSSTFTGTNAPQFPNSILQVLKPYLQIDNVVFGSASFGTDGQGQADDDFGVLRRV